MGLHVSAINFLFHARKRGVAFGKTMMLGRQSYQLNRSELRRCFRENGADASKIEAILAEDIEYTEPLLRFMGAETVHSMDASDYEHATHVHDMNQPIPASLHNQYDLVIDSGTFEHIFNFPVVIANAMKMVKPGGHLITVTPTNNFLGHGFYQFSPELFYRILSEENGFEVEDMFFNVARPFTPWYAVADPKKVRSRVILENSEPAYLLVSARKKADVPLFSKTPQQSDYEFISWTGEEQVQKLMEVKTGRKKYTSKLGTLAYKGRQLKNRWLAFVRGYGSGKTAFFQKKR
ncbi:methyltransferase domain-containing protein [Chitinophaga lutea]